MEDKHEDAPEVGIKCNWCPIYIYSLTEIVHTELTVCTKKTQSGMQVRRGIFSLLLLTLNNRHTLICKCEHI